MSNEVNNMMLEDSKDLLDNIEISTIAIECINLKKKEDEIASLEEQLKQKKLEAKRPHKKRGIYILQTDTREVLATCMAAMVNQAETMLEGAEHIAKIQKIHLDKEQEQQGSSIGERPEVEQLGYMLEVLKVHNTRAWKMPSYLL